MKNKMKTILISENKIEQMEKQIKYVVEKLDQMIAGQSQELNNNPTKITFENMYVTCMCEYIKVHIFELGRMI